MIKVATLDDLSNVANLALKLWPDSDYGELEKEMREAILNKQAFIALFMDADASVGFAHCQLRFDYVEGTESSPVGYLEGIFVDENHRNKGIAKQLLNYCEDWARKKGCKEFGSDCELENTQSYIFHLRVGFLEVNRLISFKKML